MSTPRFMDERVARVLYRRFGPGTVKDDALTPALARARLLHENAMQGSSIAELAADTAIGVVQYHPFARHNAAMAYMLMQLFLSLNGHTLTVERNERLIAMRAFAAGRMSQSAFIRWVSAHAAPC